MYNSYGYQYTLNTNIQFIYIESTCAPFTERTSTVYISLFLSLSLSLFSLPFAKNGWPKDYEVAFDFGMIKIRTKIRNGVYIAFNIRMTLYRLHSFDYTFTHIYQICSVYAFVIYAVFLSLYTHD